MKTLKEFYTGAIRIPSFSDKEKEMAEYTAQTMRELGFDEVKIDALGNVIGRIGNGKKIIHFDSHIDTVEVNDPEKWIADPFGAEEVNGKIVGRGSVDMKGGLSASIYAAVKAKENDWLQDKTVYVTGTVCEEYCDGENLKFFYADSGISPDYCIICEPSDNLLTLGHTGKVQARVITSGKSAHGSAPEKGINAVYKMAKIIERVEMLNAKLKENNGGTVVLSNISCRTASLNAVPDRCEIYLDRRLRFHECVDQVKAELDQLVKDIPEAHWEPGTLCHTSWTGKEIVYEPMHEPWKIEEDHPLVQAGLQAYAEVFGHPSQCFDYWDFGTNAITPVAMGIPTMGFGPGEYKLAHMTNECCEFQKIEEACAFYAHLIRIL